MLSSHDVSRPRGWSDNSFYLYIYLAMTANENRGLGLFFHPFAMLLIQAKRLATMCVREPQHGVSSHPWMIDRLRDRYSVYHEYHWRWAETGRSGR